MFIFDLSEPEIFIQSYLMTGTDSPISGDGELTMCLTELCGSALVHGKGISTLWGQMY